MRNRIAAGMLGVPLLAFLVWIASNTYWADVTVPMPPKGEAIRNPFYAAQRFAEALGARTAWDHELSIPVSNAVMVLAGWHWSLTSARREAIERWVESGGRIVIVGSLVGGQEEFEHWSGIARQERLPDAAREADATLEGLEQVANFNGHCQMLAEEHDNRASAEPGANRHQLCGVDWNSFLTTRETPAWALVDPSGIHAVRVRVGRGSATVINARPFLRRQLFEGDHGWVFVAATDLRKGDEIHFLSEYDHPPLLALLWHYGGSVVVLFLALVAVALWRGAIRFGPLAAAADPARRSLAEQIRGSGQFALRQGDNDPLHGAVVRALDDAARRRIPAYDRLSGRERAAAIARLTGFDQTSVAIAVNNPRARVGHALPATIALVEGARRTLIERTKAHHGRR